MQQIPVPLLTLVAGIVITLFSFWVGQNHSLMPVQASEQAPLVDGFFNVMVTIATALFIVVEGAIVIFFVKFRHRPGDNTDGEPVEGNIPLEIFWTAIPTLIVIGLGIYSVDIYGRMGGLDSGNGNHIAHSHSPAQVAQMSGSAIAATLGDDSPVNSQTPTIGIGVNSTQEKQAADLVVDVTGMQFAWIFNYPNNGVTAGELHIPVGADVQLNIAATDVIHSFWVPQFRLKQDAIPGVPTQLRFVATKEGTYPVVCAELCGGYHGSMRTQVVVHSSEDFDNWVMENQIAQNSELKTAIAVNPGNLSKSEFLTPYVDEMGINAATLTQLQP